MFDFDSLGEAAKVVPLTPVALAELAAQAMSAQNHELALLCRTAAFTLDAAAPGVADALALALLDSGAPLEAAYIASSCVVAESTRAAMPEPWTSGLKAERGIRPQACALVYNPANAAAWISWARTCEHEIRFAEAKLGFQMASQIDPGRLDIWIWLANAARAAGDRTTGLSAMIEIARKLPGNATALSNVSAMLLEMGDNENARRIGEAALSLDPQLNSAVFNVVHACMGLGRLEEAVAIARRACSIASDNASLTLATIFAAHACCDWTDIEQLHARLVDLLDKGAVGMGPFPLIVVPGVTPQHQRAVAKDFARRFEIPGAAAPTPRPLGGRKLRVGYVSSEFRDHATAYLITETLEKHDKDRFETFGFATTSAAESGFRARMRSALTDLHEIARMGDDEAAALVRNLGIDILVDLNGYTGVMRPGVFARRPAPLQVQWLGYPGTMGATFIDGLIGDPVVTPIGSEPNYTERIMRLPFSYQPNDRQRPLLAPPSRADVGLPNGAFVFCSFNSPYKITPDMFDIWCGLLREIEDSVLWTYCSRPVAWQNLLTEAEKRGIDKKRIVFAPPLGQAQHLARVQLADVFLDTFPCGAHTTASDALWCGVPVITRHGETFASRVAASLVHAVGLPELAVGTKDAYRALALRLARDSAELSRMKQQLREARRTAPLFDSEATARGLEALYVAEFARVVAQGAVSSLAR